MAEPSEVVTKAYGSTTLRFGPEYLIPKPFDPRLIVQLAPAVAQAAMDTGVATRPMVDFDAYREHLTEFVFKSGLVMKPIFTVAKQQPKRLPSRSSMRASPIPSWWDVRKPSGIVSMNSACGCDRARILS
jgi:hypothetical protein